MEKYTPLHQDDDAINQEENQLPQQKLPFKAKFWHLTSSAVALLLCGFLAGSGVSYSINDKSCISREPTYSPAQTALSYSQQNIHPHGPATYWGHPTDQQTKAWETLLEPVMIRSSYDEMAQAGENPDQSIELLNGGYLSSLHVYHDLHCLRRIRFWVYKDHFYPNMTAEQRSNEQKHVEHCLEALRVTTMCTGSTGLWSFQWKPNNPKAQAKTAAQRSCVNWDQLDGWARERAVGFNPALKPRLRGD